MDISVIYHILKMLDNTLYIHIFGYMNMLYLNESSIFKALSEEIRLRIAVLLIKGELCVCDLTTVLSVPQSTVSRHMSKLKNAGIVTDRRTGKWVYYTLSTDLEQLLPDLLTMIRSIGTHTPYIEDAQRLTEHKNSKSCN